MKRTEAFELLIESHRVLDTLNVLHPSIGDGDETLNCGLSCV